MGHSYTSCLMHVVFSTKNRQRLIKPVLQERLWPYLGGIARENDLKALAVGGVEDHIHILISMPATLSISRTVQLIKGGSSRWIHETFPEQRDFAWQEGYGAFSVGISGVKDTIAYIETQAEHHRTRTYEEELVSFLKRHGMEYDERFVFG